MNQNDYTPNTFSNAMKQLQIGTLMRKSNITKSCGIGFTHMKYFNFYYVSFSGKEPVSFPE